MADERIEIELDVTGSGFAASEFLKTERAMVSLDTVAKKTGRSFADQGDALDKVGRLVGTISPGFQTFASVVDGTAKSVLALSNVISPVGGLVIGGLVGALALWKEHSDEVTEAQKRQAEATRLAAKEAKNLDDYLREIQDERSSKSRSERINRGGASPDEIEAEIRRLSSLKLGDKDFGVKASRIGQLRAQKAEAEAADAQAILDELADDGASAPQARAAQRIRSARSAPSAARGDTLDSLMLGGDRFGDINAITGGVQSDFDRANKDRAASELAAAKDLAEQKLDIERGRLEQLEEIEAAAAERSRERNAIIMGGVQSVGNAGISAFQAMAKGQKVSSRQIIGAIGDQMVAEGTRWLFTGAAKLLMGDPSGGALIGIGTAEIGAGMTMGAIGASGGGGRSGGGGGGFGARPSEPTRGGSTSSEPVRSNVTVHVNAMVADADAGRRIKQAIGESDRVYGA